MPVAPALVLLHLTFADNFTANKNPPDGNWATTFPYGPPATRTLPGNKEAECYMDATVGKAPFVQHNFMFDIGAAPAHPGSNPCGLPYTSGLLTTFNSFNQLYGYFEICAKLPEGRGLWPAFWMLPSSNQYTAELDIFEVLGNAPSVLYFTTHGATGGTWSTNSQRLKVADTSAKYHIYGVDWEPATTTLYIDHRPVASAPTPQSMNTPMYMLINLAVGGPGSWPGPPDRATRFPANYRVAYVRAYATPGTAEVSGSAALVPAFASR
jgi:beta-glucanase (GH16 family)